MQWNLNKQYQNEKYNKYLFFVGCGWGLSRSSWWGITHSLRLSSYNFKINIIQPRKFHLSTVCWRHYTFDFGGCVTRADRRGVIFYLQWKLGAAMLLKGYIYQLRIVLNKPNRLQKYKISRQNSRRYLQHTKMCGTLLRIAACMMQKNIVWRLGVSKSVNEKQ